MKFTLPALIAALAVLFLIPASASTFNCENKFDSIHSSIVFEKEDNKEKEVVEEEPDCD